MNQEIKNNENQAPKRNEYYLIYEDGYDMASRATVGLKETLEEMKYLASDSTDLRFKKVSLQDWVNEQLSWEDGDPEHAAGIYEWAAKLAREDMKAEQAERAAKK